MASSESQTRCSATDIEPVVVVLGNMEMSGILGTVTVAVPDKRCLPVVMEITIGNCHPFRCVGDVDKPVIVVFAMVQIRVEFAWIVLVIGLPRVERHQPVVHPNVGRCLNANAIPVCRKDILADDITNNNVGLLPDVKSDANKFYKKVRSLTSKWT